MPGGVDIEYFLNFVPRIRPEDKAKIQSELDAVAKIASTPAQTGGGTVSLFKDTGVAAEVATVKVEKLGKAVANVSKSGGGNRVFGPQIKAEANDIEKEITKLSNSLSNYSTRLEYARKNGLTGIAQSARSGIMNAVLGAQGKGITPTPEQLGLLQKVTGEYKEIGKQAEKNIMSIAQWAIGWTVIYGAIRSVKTLVVNTMKDIFDLEEQVFRAVAASRFERGGLGNLPRAKEVQQLREAYTSTIKALMQSTAAAPKDMAAGLYQLASAGLTAQEALAALPNAVDLAVGSYADMEQVTRILATSYNVFGRSLNQNLSTQQKMAFIADTLAGAYNRDQIEISELTKTLEYCSPSASRLNIEFDKLVTTIGFVSNFGMRGSRAGTDLNRFFLDASKNAAKLRKEFGIELDPKQALDPIKLINQFHEADLKGRVTAAGLNRIFGTKGGESLKLILGDWEKWNKLVTDNNQALHGTARGLREIAEEATTKKIARLKNAWEAFVMGFGDTDYVRNFFDYLHTRLVEAIALMERGKNARLIQGAIEKSMGKPVAKPGGFLTRTIGSYGPAATFDAAMKPFGYEPTTVGTIGADVFARIEKSKLSPDATNIAKSRALARLKYDSIKGIKDSQKEIDKVFLEALVAGQRYQKTHPGTPSGKPASKLNVGESPDSGSGKSAEKELDRERLRNLEQEIERITTKYDLQRQFITGYGGKESDAIRIRIQEINEEIDAYRAKEGLMVTEAGKDKVRLEILKGQHDLTKESTALEIANYKDAQGKKEEYLRIFSNRETELINFRIKSLDEEIKRYEALAQFSLFMRDFEGAAKSNAAIAALQSSKGEQASALIPATAREKISDTARAFGIRQTDLEAQFNLQKEMYQMENASEEELLVIDGKRLDAQEAWNDNLNMQLLVNGLNSEEEDLRYEAARKKLGVDRESLRIQAEVLAKTRDLKDSDNEMSILKERMGILGYQDYEIAKKMLEVEGERTDILLLNQQISLEEWLLRSQSLKMANDSAMASKKERDVLDPKAALQEANVSQFPGIIQYQMKLAFYDQEIAKAREINDIQTENYWIQKKQNEERQKDIVYLDASRQMSSFIGDEMEGLITGSKSWGDVMDSINSVVLKESLKIFEELVLKAMMLKLLGWLGGMFGGGGGIGESTTTSSSSMGLGGSVMRAAGGAILPSGSSSMPITAHPKEMILPSNISNFIVDSASRARGGGNNDNQQLTLVNVIDSNFVPASMAKNPGVILNVINEDMLRSGSTRRTFRRGL